MDVLTTITSCADSAATWRTPSSPADPSDSPPSGGSALRRRRPPRCKTGSAGAPASPSPAETWSASPQRLPSTDNETDSLRPTADRPPHRGERRTSDATLTYLYFDYTPSSCPICADICYNNIYVFNSLCAILSFPVYRAICSARDTSRGA